MKIAIDISPILYGTGVSVYTKELVENLLRLDSKNSYLLFGGSLRRRSEFNKFAAGFKGNFQTKFLPIAPTVADFVWNSLHIVSVEKIIGKIDVFHSSDWTQPPTRSFKVTTVHDLAPLKFPKLTHPKIVAVHKRRLEWVQKEIDRVIVPSKATASDLRTIGINSERIRVIPEAPISIFKPSGKERITKLKKKYNITGKYLLGIGINPRKNTERIVKAFDLVRAGEDLKMILVGTPNYINVKPRRDLRMVGHVKEEELPILYSGAEALVYPSIYEGFGLPILEAMACGCPVVTSNLSSMKEVAGNAAVLVDPLDVESIVNGIKTAIGSKKTLSDKGLQRAKRFSWEKTAKETIDVYNEAS